MMNLTRERSELAWSLFQDGESYRDAQAIAADALIDTLAYAIDWNRRALGQRSAANWNPEDAPVNNEYRIIEEDHRITIVVYRDGAHAGHYIFDSTPAGRAAMRRRIAVLERNYHTRQIDPTDYEPEDMPPAPPIDNPETEDRDGPKVDRTAQRAYDKAAYHLANGLKVARDGADWLIPSGTRPGLVHRIHNGRCNCEAANAGRACWHMYVPALMATRRAA